MTLEALLAAVHLLAVLTLVVFLSSQAALCRAEWMNAAVVRRLARLDVIYLFAAAALLLTGLARLYWGTKGMTWYFSQPLFHVKMTLFVLVALLSIKPSLTFRRWVRGLAEGNALPDAQEVASTRRWIMVQAHLVPVIAVVAVFWARGM
jgi:putative membrane protein